MPAKAGIQVDAPMDPRFRGMTFKWLKSPAFSEM
jgi:hypothetical protein